MRGRACRPLVATIYDPPSTIHDPFPVRSFIGLTYHPTPHRMRYAALLLGVIVLAGPVRAQSNLVQPTDLFQIRELGNVAVSPDGQRAVYTVREIIEHPEHAGRRTYRTRLWLADIDGQAPPRPLTRNDQDASQPAWHPAGDRIAFTRSDNGRQQVFILPLDGGESYPVTDLPHGASAPAFSPDGRALLVASSLPWRALDTLSAGVPTWASERPGRAYRDLPASVRPDPDGTPDQVRAFLDRRDASIVEVTTRLDFQGEQRLETEPSFRHLFVVPLDGSEMLAVPDARPLTQGFASAEGGAWTPDGRYVVFSALRDATRHPDHVLDSVLRMVATSGGEAQTLLGLDGWTLGQPLPSPDGRYVAFIGGRMDELGFQENEIGLLDRSTGAVTWLTETFDRSAGQVAFAPDGRNLYFVAPTDGGFPLYRIALDARAPTLERLTDLETGIRSFDVGPGAVAFVRTSVDNPYELFASPLVATIDAPRQLTRHNADWLAGKRLSRPDHRTLTRIVERDGAPADTFRMDYWVMEPVGRQPGERYPVLLQIHGGPSAMWGPGEATMWHEFQMFTARGFGVVYSNPRGSGGYGRAFRYANYRDWGHGPTADVLAALDAAIAAGDWIDPAQQVVTGGSYAGYLTAWIVAHTDRFRAAAAQRGVYDLATFFGEGNAWRLVPNHFGVLPWEDDADDLLRAQSPLTFVDRITTPLLIKHGSEDLRTGVIQSEVLYRSLKLLGRPVEYIRYPDAGHELSRSGDPDQRLDRLLRIYEFLERHVD
jgi:dipeptidyl aminopeptidase/acylaminoacyl peptidase